MQIVVWYMDLVTDCSVEKRMIYNLSCLNINSEEDEKTTKPSKVMAAKLLDVNIRQKRETCPDLARILSPHRLEYF